MQDRSISYVKSVIKYCRDILDIQESFGKSYEEYVKNKGYQYSISFCIEQIGELIKKLRDVGFDVKYTDVAWNEISGLRNRIAHGYDVIDIEMVYDIGITDIPELLTAFENILKEETKGGE